MDHFESLVKTLLEASGYWVCQSFKVGLTPEEKRAIQNPSIPRPEIDLLALDLARNQILVLEVKSYLDSPGVRLSELQKEYEVAEGAYKMFTSTLFREVVLNRLQLDLQERGMANKKTKFQLGLAAGHVYQNNSQGVQEHMNANDWLFWSPEEIKERVTALADMGYSNDLAIITAKILLR